MLIFQKLLDRASKINGLEPFYRQLDLNFNDTRNFAENWLISLESETKVSNESISEVMELNQFIFVNQEAIRKIIKKHDKNNMNQLLPFWR